MSSALIPAAPAAHQTPMVTSSQAHLFALVASCFEATSAPFAGLIVEYVGYLAAMTMEEFFALLALHAHREAVTLMAPESMPFETITRFLRCA